MSPSARLRTPPKSAGQKAIDHFIGSQAFIAAGRIGHVCVAEMEAGEDEEPKRTGRILFANAKNNAHVMMPTLAYRVREAIVGQDPDTRDNIAAPHVVWDDDPVEINADQAVAASNGAGKSAPRGAQDKVQAFVREMLKDGPVAAKQVEAEAGRRGFTDSQLKTARVKLAVDSYKSRKGRGCGIGEGLRGRVRGKERCLLRCRFSGRGGLRVYARA